MVLSVYVVVAFGVAWFFNSQATTTIVFTRHANVDDPADAAGDPPLNGTGRARAELLARLMRGIDVVGGVDAIYAAATRRSRQTVEPLARDLGIEVRTAEPDAIEPFMRAILDEHKGEIVLVVTDRDEIAPLVEELHGSKNIAEIAPDDFENLFIVSVPWGGGAKVKTLQLLYGVEWMPAAGAAPADEGGPNGR